MNRPGCLLGRTTLMSFELLSYAALPMASVFSVVLAWPILMILFKLLLVYLRVTWRNAKGVRMKGEAPILPFGHFNQVNFFGRPLSRKHGSVYYIWNCLTPVLILSDAEAIRSFYSDHYSHKRDPDFTCLGAIWKQVLGDCLANSHGRLEVKRCRGPFEKYFTTNIVTGFLSVIGRECKTFLRTLPINEPIDLMQEGLSNVTLRVLVQLVYGEEVLNKYFDKIVQISEQLQDTTTLFSLGQTRLPLYCHLSTNASRQAEEFNNAWSAFNQFLFKEYSEGRLGNCGEDLFFMMMGQLKSGALNLSERELLHSVDEILLLNVDVSFTATSYALSDIAKYHQIQEKLRQEIDRALDGRDPSTFQDLEKRLPYMEMVLKESARMHPALALSLPERTVKPWTGMGGYQIPQGTPVCVDAYSLNYNEKYWTNPDVFQPERFAQGSRQVPGSYFRFGMGPRKCLGHRYALAIARIVVAAVLQKYTIRLADPEATDRLKTKGMIFFTPYICPEIVFAARETNKLDRVGTQYEQPVSLSLCN